MLRGVAVGERWGLLNRPFSPEILPKLLLDLSLVTILHVRINGVGAIGVLLREFRVVALMTLVGFPDRSLVLLHSFRRLALIESCDFCRLKMKQLSCLMTTFTNLGSENIMHMYRWLDFEGFCGWNFTSKLPAPSLDFQPFSSDNGLISRLT